jgi:hypothetical protein
MKQLLISITLLFSISVLAQKIPSSTIDLDNVDVETKTPLPYRTIEILDVRFDRSNIGTVSFMKKANSNRIKTTQTVALFPDSLHRYLPNVLGKLFDFHNGNKDTLVLLLKQFRVSDRIHNGMNHQYEPALFLRISFSAFSKKNGQLLRLFSVDDFASHELPTDRVPKEEVMQSYRSEALLVALQKLFRQRNWQSTGTAGFDIATVQQGIEKRFRLPLFTDSLQRMGVYKTFKEFKQNRPSLVNVKLDIKKDKLVSVTNADGKPLDLKGYWGVSTGKKHYIIFRNELCELFRSDKSFYFQSYLEAGDLSGQGSYGDYATQAGVLGGAVIKNVLNKDEERYFFLNMDEETVHLEEIFGKSSLKQIEKEILN